jgi:hypothetical protein
LSEIIVFLVGFDALLHYGVDTVYHGCIQNFDVLVVAGFFPFFSGASTISFVSAVDFILMVLLH